MRRINYRSIRPFLVAVCASVVWYFSVYLISEALWFDPKGLQLIGVLFFIFVLIIYKLFGISANIVPTDINIKWKLRWVLKLIWLNKAIFALLFGVIFLLLSLIVIGPEELMWDVESVVDSMTDKGSGFLNWLSWNPLVNGFILIAGIATLFLLRRQIWSLLSGISVLSLLLLFDRFMKMKMGTKLSTSSTLLMSIFLVILGRPIDFFIIFTIFLIVLYKGWPRKNPFATVPIIKEFNLNVVRVLGVPALIPILLIMISVVSIGISITIYSGLALYPLVLSIAVAQILFMMYVERSNTVQSVWTKVTVFPQDNMILWDRTKAGTGESSLIQLKLGAFRLKERKGLTDNFYRFLGWYLFESEPLGVVKESGEKETFEVYINCNGYEFELNNRKHYRAQAILKWIGSKK